MTKRSFLSAIVTASLLLGTSAFAMVPPRDWSDIEAIALAMARAGYLPAVAAKMNADTVSTKVVGTYKDASGYQAGILIQVIVKGEENGAKVTRTYEVREASPGIVEQVTLKSTTGPVGP